MASLKQKLQDAALALAQAKQTVIEAQRNFDEIFKQATSGKSKRTPSTPSAVDEPVENGGAPLARAVDRIEAVLSNPEVTGQAFTYKDISNAIGLPLPSVKPLLYRMKKAGKAVRVGRGLWRAAQQNLAGIR